MTTIVENHGIEREIVLSERVVTSEFRILEIHESIQNRFVRAEIELGPFVTTSRPNGEEETRGSSRQGITIWENESYDQIRDTWRNEDLLAVIKQLLNG